MKTFKQRSAIASTLAVGLLGLFAQTSAADSSKIVRIDDLDLTQAADVGVLYDRIQRAARRVCRDESSPWDGKRSSRFARCEHDAVDDAVRTVNHPALAILHRAEGERLAGERRSQLFR